MRSRPALPGATTSRRSSVLLSLLGLLVRFVFFLRVVILLARAAFALALR